MYLKYRKYKFIKILIVLIVLFNFIILNKLNANCFDSVNKF